MLYSLAGGALSMSMVIIQAIMAATHITHDMDNKNNNNTTYADISQKEKMILQVCFDVNLLKPYFKIC